MLDWFRLLSMAFFAPGRALREVRDRATLAPAGLLALTVQVVFFLTLAWLFLPGLFLIRKPLMVLMFSFQAAGFLLFIALVFVPVTVFLVNLVDHRASYRLVLQQEYAAFASTLFYGWAASSLMAFILTLAGKFSGVLQVWANHALQDFLQQRDQLPPELVRLIDPRFLSPQFFSAAAAFTIMILIFTIWASAAVKIVFRISSLRSTAIVLISGVLLLPLFVVVQPILGMILGSPFLLLMLFLLLRGYLSEVTRTQRSRAAFKQNLEAATLNPADASAHYNLGLIHQQRGELEASRERFERAVQIDEGEIDAHYQLGRIARQQKRLSDAIRNFEQVVSRDPAHAQHEIWREAGATYIAAGQFEDARMALDRFLEHRPSDPEGLYLLGRAHAGLGHGREAASLMEACINAVKTAPAYKYRLEKRWLNEAQQFLRTQS
jgi:tetratricopeptide (TPR) repeat protein